MSNKMTTFDGLLDYHQMLKNEIPKMGVNNQVSGFCSYGFGKDQLVTGSYGFSVGLNNKIRTNKSIALGSNNIISAPTASGFCVIGNGVNIQNPEGVNKNNFQCFIGDNWTPSQCNDAVFGVGVNDTDSFKILKNGTACVRLKTIDATSEYWVISEPGLYTVMIDATISTESSDGGLIQALLSVSSSRLQLAEEQPGDYVMIGQNNYLYTFKSWNETSGDNEVGVAVTDGTIMFIKQILSYFPDPEGEEW